MKNILLIVVDTLRPDHLGCYGYDRPTSPHLDDLAARGSVLTGLWSVSNFTAPAFTSLFTGLHPHHHGVFDFTAQARTSPFTGIIAANRIRTAGVVTIRFFGNLLRNVWGPIEAVTDTRGFDFSKNLPCDVTASSLEWLRQNGHGPDPFFLFVHYDGPHTPFRLPDEYAHPFDSVPPDQVDPAVESLLFPRAERLDGARNKTSMYRFMKDVNWGRRKLDGPTLQWIVDKYDAAVRYNDLAIGDLLEGLREQGLAADTVVAVLSDHGEEFLEHGGFAHGGIHLYEEIIRTVGIIHDPSRPGTGSANSRPCSQVDMLASLLDLAGAEGLSPEIDGVALLDSSRPAGPVFCHGKSKLAVRDGVHKMIVPRPNPALGAVTRLKMWLNLLRQGKLRLEIFDLEQDPGETRNLAGDGNIRKRMQGLLAGHLASRPRAILADTRIGDDERRRIEQEMKDLGYM